MPSNTNEFIFRLIGLYNKFFFTPSVILPKLPPGQTIRFGLISAALINGPAIISPSLHYPEVEIVAVAARQKEQAVAYAKANGIKVEKAYGGYQALLDDQDVDAVFIGLPNGLHAGEYSKLYSLVTRTCYQMAKKTNQRKYEALLSR